MRLPTAADSPPQQRRKLLYLITGCLLLALWCCFMVLVGARLALSRQFHVDELQVAYNAALWGLHRLPEWSNYAAPFLVPLSLIVSRGGETWPVLIDLRLCFFTLFAVNLVLVAVCAQVPGKLTGRAAALCAITLVEPLWRHGFEIRHDSILLAMALCLFLLTRRAAAGTITPWSFFLAGVAAATAQANSFKAFLYWPSGLLLLLLFGALGGSLPRLRAVAGALAAGTVVGLSVNLGVLAAAGRLTVYLENVQGLVAAASTGPARFGSSSRLLDVLADMPFVTGLALWAIILLTIRWRRAEVRPSDVVPVAWLGLQLVALSLNPAPYSYNFLHVLPFLFLVSLQGFIDVFTRLRHGRALLIAASLIAMFVAYVAKSRRDPMVALPGDFQRSYIEAVEALTAPLDPVVDGVGLVLTRRPAGRDWMLHSLFVADYRSGKREQFRDLLKRDPAPVLLTNYRWNWLSSADWAFIRSNYVQIHPRLLVLGGLIPPSATSLRVLRPGRYLLEPTPQPPRGMRGQGQPSATVLELAAGSHSMPPATSPVLYAWLGPGLERHPAVLPLPPNRDLFGSD